MNLRPSNLLRHIENGVITTAVVATGGVLLGARGIATAGRAAKSAVARASHEVALEVEARQMAKHARRIMQEQDALARMSPEAAAQHRADRTAIDLRVQELLNERRVHA
jgi:hypothetical protein